MAGYGRGGRTPGTGRVSVRGREGRMPGRHPLGQGRPSSELRASIRWVRAAILRVRGGHSPGQGRPSSGLGATFLRVRGGHSPGQGRPSSGLGATFLRVLGGLPSGLGRPCSGSGRPYNFALVGARALLLFWPPPTGQPSFLSPPSYFRFDIYPVPLKSHHAEIKGRQAVATKAGRLRQLASPFIFT
jgi:hypothetical protein